MITLSSELPEHLRGETEAIGTGELTQYIRPPFIKIVQGSAESALKELFEEQSVILVPGNDLVAEPGQKILFTPILFYVEYLIVNPIELKGDLPMVAERTFDRKSIIAKRCGDPNLRLEQLFNPDGTPMLKKQKPLFRSYQDTRIFLIEIHSPVQPGRVCALTFSRAELKTADRLSTLISARQKSIFAGVYEMTVETHKNPEWDWYGFRIDNPSEGSPWTTGEQYAQHKQMNALLQAALDDKRLVISADDLAGRSSDAESNSAAASAEADGVVDADAKF